MEVKIDKLKDIKAAYKIAESLPEFFNEKGLKKIKEALEKENSFGAYLEDELVGFVTIREADSNVIEISWIGVLPQHHKKGIGSKLLNESLLKYSGNYKIAYGKTLSDTIKDEGYSQTRNFWFKNGFYPLETIDPYPGWDPGNPCLIFVKSL
jgi:GNAT superfamily N-acetyltransferase